MDNQNHHSPESKSEWERNLIEKLAFAALEEQKRSRRWGIFFKLLTLAALVIIPLIAAYPELESEMGNGETHVAVVHIQGEIMENAPANAKDIIDALRAAAKDKNAKAIMLNINSPGGSPVQAAYVYDEIKRLKQLQPDLPIYTVVGDICASGGYFIAAASDKIFVNPASLIGSIGVVMNGFGFTQTMDKLGIERRLLTAGDHKAMLDPFSAVKPQETQHMQGLLNQVHQQFIDAVRAGRGDRLKDTPAHQLFSGLVWTGSESIKIGIADALGNVDSVSRDEFGTENLVDYTLKEHILDRLAGKLGTSFGHAISSRLLFDLH